MFPIVAALTFLACAPDLSEGRPVATVEEVKPAAPTEAPAPAPAAVAGELPVPALTAPTVLEVDTSKSKLGALGAKISATHPLEFHDYAGSVGLDGDTVNGIAFAAAIGTLTSDNEKLTEHLKGEDFLWAEKHPHATFVSTEIKPEAKDKFTHSVTGDLTIRGKTLRVTFPATIAVSPSDVKANTEFVVDRKAFDVVYPGKADDLVQDNVVLKIDFVAPRA
jgi:polyisoprenoid-binding protein YceI